MKMRLIYHIIIIFHAVLLYSCNPKPDYIRIAESTIEQHPDSALLLLELIVQPNSLNETDWHEYTLLKIQAKDKLYQDITADTAILGSVIYYTKKKDFSKLARVQYYCGRFWHERGSFEKAIKAYLQASQSAENVSNINSLKGVIEANIGYLLFRESNYSDALIHFRTAFEYFQKGNKITESVSIKADIGNCYTMIGENDSAYFYYNQSYTLACKSGLQQIKLIALQNLALVYQLQGDNNKAIALYKKSLSLTDNTMDAKIYLSLARMYSQINNQDSTSYYFGKASNISKNIQDPYFAASLDAMSSEINERAGNFQEALSDYKKYSEKSDILFEEREKKSILDIQHKYNFERIKNHNNELYIKNIHFFVLVLFLGIMLVCVLCIFYYYHQKKNRELDDAANKINQLNNLALSYNEKRNSFRDILLHHFDILRKSATLQTYLREDEMRHSEKILKKFNDIVYKQNGLDWNMLYIIMNELHDGFLDKLKQNIPELDESEFRICCLIHSSFTNQEMALIMKLSLHTITHKRTAIRKKIGIKDYDNINKRLKELSDNK